MDRDDRVGTLVGEVLVDVEERLRRRSARGDRRERPQGLGHLAGPDVDALAPLLTADDDVERHDTDAVGVDQARETGMPWSR